MSKEDDDSRVLLFKRLLPQATRDVDEAHCDVDVAGNTPGGDNTWRRQHVLLVVAVT